MAPDSHGTVMLCTDPRDVPGLREVVVAVEARARRNQPTAALRPLVVQCAGPRPHVIARVYQVAGRGPVLVTTTDDHRETGETQVAHGLVVDDATGETVEADEELPVSRHRHRVLTVAAVLADQHERYGPRHLAAQCRCRTTVLDTAQLRELLAGGRHRVRVGVPQTRRLVPG